MSDRGDVAWFAAMLYMLHESHPFSVTSWFRTPRRNAEVGGHPRSRHLDGLAVDLVMDEGVEATEFTKMAKACGLHLVDEGSHIHVQAVPPRVEQA